MKQARFLLPFLVACGAGTPDPALLGERPGVFVFVTTDCPIANSYAEDLRALAGEAAAAGLRFRLVHVDHGITRDAAEAHAKEYGLTMELVLDPEHRLVRALHATTTPEAFVVLGNGTVAYRGRIDDAWAELGQRKHVVKHHELADAIRAVAQGRPPEVRETTPIGCVIE